MALSVRKYRLLGFKELDKALESLTHPKFRRAALRRSGKAAMQPILEAAKAKAPTLQNAEKGSQATKGLLKNDIKMSTRVNITPNIQKNGKIRKTSKHELSVMVKTGKKTEGYALVIEYGRDESVYIQSSVVFGKKTKEHAKTTPAFKAQPFMRPAMDENASEVFLIFRRELEKEIASQVKKQAKFLAKQNSK